MKCIILILFPKRKFYLNWIWAKMGERENMNNSYKLSVGRAYKNNIE